MAIYQLSWSAPTTRTDGTALSSAEIQGYVVKRVFGGNTTEFETDTTTLILDIGADSGTGVLTVAAIDIAGAESAYVPVPSVTLYNNVPVLSVKLTAISARILTTDPDGDAVNATIQTQGTKGVASVTNSLQGIVRYAPNNGTSGTDSFTVKLSDGRTGGDITQVITVDISNWRISGGGMDVGIARPFA